MKKQVDALGATTAGGSLHVLATAGRMDTAERELEMDEDDMSETDPREQGFGIAELAFRREQAHAMGGAEAVRRQHERGRLTIRERIAALSDEGAFRELGTLTGAGSYDDDHRLLSVTPAPYVGGISRIDGRPVAVGGEDFTVRGGTSFSSTRRKGGQGGLIEDLAAEYLIPLVNLIDGAGGSVASIRRRGHSVFPGVHGFERSVELLDLVPVASAVLGTAAGGPAGRAILSHFSVMVRDTSHIFAAGPPIVRRSLGHDIDKEELGGPDVAIKASGTIHNLAESEADAFRQIRRFLSYLPANVRQLPPVSETSDPVDRADDELSRIVPENRRRPYDMRRLIEMVIDRESGFEIQPLFGQSVITMLARLGGVPVGIVANNPMVYGGAMDDRSAKKQVEFATMCQKFHLPVVFLVDVPGFLVGKDAESRGTLREGMKAVIATAKLEVPVVTVVIRKCYGMAGAATTSKNGADLKFAWPTAEWGSLPVEGGVAAAYRREISAASDPARAEREIEAELRAYSSPFRTAEAFGVEELIDPRETRGVLCEFAALARGGLESRLTR